MDSDEHILLASLSESGPWSLIGGSVNDGESDEEALKRHAFVDVGLEIEIHSVVMKLDPEKYRFIYECGADQTWDSFVYSISIRNKGIDAPLLTQWFSKLELKTLYLDEFASVALVDLGLK